MAVKPCIYAHYSVAAKNKKRFCGHAEKTQKYTEICVGWHNDFQRRINPAMTLFDGPRGLCKQAQAAAGYTIEIMPLKHYVRGYNEHRNTAAFTANACGLEN